MAIRDVTEKMNLMEKRMTNCVLQPWVLDCFFMMQSVLCAAVRGPDGIGKYHPCKYLLRWYRRCLLITAFERDVIVDPFAPGGGSFTGPAMDPFPDGKRDPQTVLMYSGYLHSGSKFWEATMDSILDEYLRSLDEIPHHFQMHFLHAVEIMGYFHSNERIRKWWNKTYLTLVNDLHLNPETKEQLEYRLGDKHPQWIEANNKATTE